MKTSFLIDRNKFNSELNDLEFDICHWEKDDFFSKTFIYKVRPEKFYVSYYCLLGQDDHSYKKEEFETYEQAEKYYNRLDRAYVTSKVVNESSK